MKRWIRDLWRGWSDEDLENAIRKVCETAHKPGGIIPMSSREMAAYIAHHREKYR